MSDPAVGRAMAWVDCKCGAEVVFPDLEPDGITSIRAACKGCGRTLQIVADIEVRQV